MSYWIALMISEESYEPEYSGIFSSYESAIKAFQDFLKTATFDHYNRFKTEERKGFKILIDGDIETHKEGWAFVVPEDFEGDSDEAFEQDFNLIFIIKKSPFEKISGL